MPTKKKQPEPQNPLILRSQRLMEAFAKSDDERDFYLDRVEGFIVYVDLDQSQENLDKLDKELEENPERYVIIPKLTFYETKKFMEGFIHEKVYDIDTKEKLIDIIGSKEARENFLEFLCDHHTEFEKWQQYYQERSRVRIIEWLRQNHFHFVFEEDLDLGVALMEKIKRNTFETKVGKDVINTRKILSTKAKSYYSNEALNPRPKRGRPPKQQAKTELEPQLTSDIYTTVPSPVRPFLFTPDLSNVGALTFSSKFESEEELIHRKQAAMSGSDDVLDSLNQKLESLRNLSNRWHKSEEDQMEEEAKSHLIPDEGEEKEEEPPKQKKAPSKKAPAKKAPKKKAAPKKETAKKTEPKKETAKKKPAAKKAPAKKTAPKKKTTKKK